MRKLKTRMDRSNQRLSLGKAIDFDMIEEEKRESEEDVIVRSKSYYLDPMSIEEAISRMEALGHSFFLYLDEEDDQISVVYVRNDGGYGVWVRIGKNRWQCRNCGAVIESEKAPEMCPVCAHPKAYFQIEPQNY